MSRSHPLLYGPFVWLPPNGIARPILEQAEINQPAGRVRYSRIVRREQRTPGVTPAHGDALKGDSPEAAGAYIQYIYQYCGHQY